MGRPTDFSSRRSGGKAAPSNPFAAWIEGRKQRQFDAREKAAKMITNTIAKNEATIVDQLNSVDFLHSRLPESVLTKKSRPGQTCSDLEYATKAIINMLLTNPQTIKTDIREIDKRLLTLVLLFKQAVEQGDKKAAYTAKGALVRGMNEIRTRIPQNQPQLSKQFVELNSKYLDEWITLVGLAQVADRTRQNYEAQKREDDLAKAKAEAIVDDYVATIEDDKERLSALYHILEHDTPEERGQWTPMQRQVHAELIDFRMKKVRAALSDVILYQKEIDLKNKEGQIDTLRTKLASVPIVADPDLLNQFQDAIDDLFEQLAKSDAEIDETLKTLDDIEGRIKQLDSAPGAIRARETAAEAAEELVDAIQKKQKAQNANFDENSEDYMKSLGIKTKAELAEIQTDNERKQREAEEAAYERITQAQAQQKVKEAHKTLISN